MKLPEGFSASGVASGIKAGRARDLGLLVADTPVVWAGTFTRNAAAAAPVRWCEALRGRPVRAVVVNSGNANACTGTAGVEAVAATAAAAASRLGCSREQILVASTGPIGQRLPVEKLAAALPRAAEGLLERDPRAFAEAIMTTDTRRKVASRAAGAGTVVGVAKGAAMVAPNMATMLAFLTTDVGVEASYMQQTLTQAVDASFNLISIDGCESTNDSVFLFSSGLRDASRRELDTAVHDVCADLARQIVLDAEGATKLVRIEVAGATSDAAAADLGRSIAGSALWRAAAHGGDPNWGRIAAALGQRDRDLDLRALEISIGPEKVFSCGEPVGSLESAAKAMEEDCFSVHCVVGAGPGWAEVLSADLSPAYVDLNATGTS